MDSARSILLAAGLAGGVLTVGSADRETGELTLPPGPPTITHHYPAGGRVGDRFELEVGGSWPAWPIQAGTSEPGLRLLPAEEAGRFEVSIRTNVVPGPLLLWFFNEQGAAAPRQFVIGTAPELTEREGVRAAAGLPVATFPVTLNGRVSEPDESDAWLLPLTEPVHLTARLSARRIDSPLMPRLALWGDAEGPLVAADATPETDPEIEADLKTPGLYTLRVTGRTNGAAHGPAAVYRVLVEAEALPPPPTNTLSTYGRPLTTGILRPVLSRNVLTPPDSAYGFINPHGDVDVYGLETRPSERYTIRLNTGGAPPFVARLEIASLAGEPLREETGTAIELDWVSPNGESYVLRVSEASGGGAPTHSYRLSVDGGKPEFEATVATNAVRLPPGEEAVLHLTLRRPPDDRTVFAVTSEDLPAGVELLAPTLLPEMNTAVLRLRAAVDAPPTSGLLQLSLLPLSGGGLLEAPVSADILGRHAPPGALWINEAPGIWLTIPPPDH